MSTRVPPFTNSRLYVLDDDLSSSSSRIPPTPPTSPSPVPRLLIFSGGTGINSFSEKLKCYTGHVSYILPVSDDGGSSHEIRRVLGGPSIGDIRSRCIRLASSCPVSQLLQYRLDPNQESNAKMDWYSIIHGEHPLWSNLDPHLSSIVKSLLIHFNHELLLRHNPNEPFQYRNGSIGNFFFSGARLFFNSIESAIFLFTKVSSTPIESRVIPILPGNVSVGIGVELENGQKIIGQNLISHPSLSESTLVDKSKYVPLPSRIRRLFYVNGDNQEINPAVNKNVLQSIETDGIIIYGMGSLYTSLLPLLILRGVGEILSRKRCSKFLFLNGYLDRETDGMTALDFIKAIVRGLNRENELNHSASSYITHLFYVETSNIYLDKKAVEQLGIRVFSVPALKNSSKPVYDEKKLFRCLCQCLSE